jgi:hypothetical protein
VFRRIGVAISGIWLALVFLASPAHAATGRQSFRVIFSGDPRAGTPGTVILTGLVNARGTDETIEQHPHPDGSETDVDVFTLPGGTLTVEDTDPGGIFDFNPMTCVATIGTNGGVFSIKGGTGAYAGASGSGTFSAKGVVVFDRIPGGCSEEPRSFTAIVTGTGTLNLP